MVWKPKIVAHVVVQPPIQPVQGAAADTLPMLNPASVGTPMPYQGSMLNSVSPDGFINKFAKRGDGGVQSGPSFMDVLNYSIRRNLLNSIGKGKTSLHSHETRVKRKNLNKVQDGLGSKWKFEVNNDIIDGGRIWVLWDPSLFNVSVIKKELQVMHLSVIYQQTGFCWTCSMVYGCNKDTDRRSLWSSLTNLASGISGPWLVMGDFNNVLYADERIGAKSKDGHFSDTVKDVWTKQIRGCLMFQVAKKLKMLKGPLKKLNREGFGNILNTAEVARMVLEEKQAQLHLDPQNLMLQIEERAAAQSFKELHKAKHSFLGQKAKINWMHRNDENTHYFHSSIKVHRAQNKVLSIMDMNGNLCSDNSTIEQAFIDYYHRLLGSSERVTRVNLEVVRRGKSVSDIHASAMVIPVTATEVRSALFSMPNEKASGLDVSRPVFSRIHMISLERMWLGLSWSFSLMVICCIKLIPLCYLSFPRKRLNAVLADIISMNQSAFLQNRNIVDNILICQDLVRLYNRKSCSPRVMMKIDLRKGFRFHPMCKAPNLCHPAFDDDLLIFCRGDPASVTVIMRAMIMFFEASGLHINKDKSDIYMNGVAAADEQVNLSISRFKKGSLPFKYLGITISYKRISNVEFSILVDKLVARSRGWGAKHLSYAGRMLLVKAVLTQIHSYWARIFLLPKAIIHKSPYSTNAVYKWLSGDHLKETSLHLFFKCPFSKRCLQLVQQWLGFCWTTDVIARSLTWRDRSVLRKKIILAALASLVYFIWEGRNKCRVETWVPHPEHIKKRIHDVLIGRLTSLRMEKVHSRDMNWVKEVGLI
ncbi:uncharacterized protein LOC141629726 [Silene latifolia]|uniref:uncharacterized protein LOC141629726 n=1 Tax=Silene latifolia TaxID=37657 RepID=UPI003D7867A8